MSQPLFSSSVSRRAFLTSGLGLAVAATMVGLAGCGGGDGSDANFVVTATPTPTPSPSPSPTIVEVALNVQRATIPFVATGGVTTINVRTYNGAIGGPTIRVAPGEILRLQVTNNLEANADENVTYASVDTPHHFNTTNIHTHGLHVSPSNNGDNVFIEIEPGSTFTYEYAIPSDHPPGTYWYHPHKHGSAAMQLASGMGGALIVTGGLDDIPEIAAAQDIVVLISEMNILTAPVAPVAPFPALAAGEVPNYNTAPPTFPLGRRTFAVNGQSVNSNPPPTFNIQPGEVQRWRLLNAGLRSDIPFSIQDGANVKQQFHIIARDGISLAAMQTVDEVLISPGARADILVVGPAVAGTYSIVRASVNPGGGADAQVTLGNLVVAGAVLNMALPTALAPPASLPTIQANEVTRFRRLEFRHGLNADEGPPVNAAGGAPFHPNFSIDGRLFDPDTVDHVVPLGAVEEWTVSNVVVGGQTTVVHPFHIHVNPFQLISVNGVALNPPEWRDTVNVPIGGEFVIRHRFQDFTGLFVLHCHNLVHEDIGMMQVVQVV